MPCSIEAESFFGPQVAPDCRDGFDFTLLFEELILTLIPLCFVSLTLPLRLWQLLNQNVKANVGSVYFLKLIASTIYSLLQLGLLVLLCIPGAKAPKTWASTPIAAFTLAVSLMFVFLSHLEHTRNVRPSTIITLFHAATVVFDAVRARTIWALPGNMLFSVVFTAAVGVKLVITVLESVEKRKILRDPYKNSPRETLSGVFNRNVFWWLNPLLGTGFSKIIDIVSLPEIDDRLNCPVAQIKLQKRWDTLKHKHPNSLLWMLLSHYKWAVLAAVIPRLCLSGFTFAQPFLFERVVGFISEPKANYTDNHGYGLILAAVIIYFGIAITTTNNQHKTYRVITMVRGSLVSLIYKGTLPLSTAAVKESVAVTLMSADVERVGTGMRFMHEAWASLLDIALAFWLLQRQLGVASVAPGAIFFLCSLAALGVAASMGSRQREWLEAIQKRVKTTSDMLGSMKEVRMTGLQLRLKEELQQQRKEEITASRGFKNALTLIVTLSYITITLAPVIAFTMFSLIAKKNGHPPLDRGRAFTCLTLFALLSSPMALIIEAIGGVVTAIGSVQRIGLYLSMSEKSGRYASTDEDSAGQILPGEEKSNTAVSHTNNMLPWGEMLGNLGPNMVVATGASAGWEKDKPFVIKDLSFNIRKGTTTFIIGPVGSGKSTLLRAIVGETTTSGGLLRVAFSQAAFCSQAPWITNDTIRNNILGTSLYDKSWYETVLQACALNTDVSHLPNGDQQMAGSKGVNLSGGQQARLALARAVYSRKEFVLLDDVMSGLDSRAEETLFQNLFGETGLFKALGLTVVFATNAVRRISYADHIIALTRDGTIEEQGTFDQLASASKQDQKVAAQNEESGDENAKTQIGRPAVEIPAPPPPDTTDRRTGDRTVYKYYIKSVGIWNAIIFTALCASFVFALIFPQYLVKWWTDDNALLGNEKTGYYLGGYAGLGLLGIASLTLSCWHLVVHMMPRASTEFHDALLDTTLNAQFTLFTEVDIGTTTNRFSQDLQLIDMELPLSLFNTTVGILQCVAQFTMIAISAKYIGAVLPALLFAFFILQKFYLRTARQLRLLDIEAKAPLFSKFLEALEGLVTIRAFGWQAEFERCNTEVTDTSQRPYYLLYCVQRWLNLVLDLIVTAIAFIVVTIAVRTIGKIDPGLIGIALVNIVNFSVSIKGLIANWTTLETSIGAVSRVRSFKIDTQSEHRDCERDVPPPEWPFAGHIEFRNVTASWKASADPVIKNFSLAIAPGQKLAICGQSGSGKSSIISTLFRLLDPSQGSILIDGLDISALNRQSVRSRLICVTQTPYLLPGALVRANIDPFNNATDQEITAALKEVQLWDAIEKMGGLDVELEPDSFSVGERQLLCLARAMLRHGSILVLDEATASVDVDTDELMQDIIRKHFAHHTVIAIAHRLNTILDFDRVAVVARGELLEYDSPRVLLGKPSAFRDAYDKSSHGRVEHNVVNDADEST